MVDIIDIKVMGVNLIMHTREMKQKTNQMSDTIMEEGDAIITDFITDEVAITMAEVVIMERAAMMDIEVMEVNVIVPTREIKVRINQMQCTIMEEGDATITDIITDKVAITMAEVVIMEKAAIMDIEVMEVNVIIVPTREIKVRINQMQCTIMQEGDTIIIEIITDKVAITMAEVVIMEKAAIMDIEVMEVNVIIVLTREIKVRINQMQCTIMQEGDTIIIEIITDKVAITMAEVVIMEKAAIMDIEVMEVNVIIVPIKEMKARMNQMQCTIMEEGDATTTDIITEEVAITMAEVVIMEKAAIMDIEVMEVHVIIVPTREMKARMNQMQCTIMEEGDATITDIIMDQVAITMAEVVIMERTAIMDIKVMEVNVIIVPTREIKVRINQMQCTIMQEGDAIITDIITDEVAITMAEVVIMERAAIMDIEVMEVNAIIVPTREIKVRMNQMQCTIMEEGDATITDVITDEVAITMAGVIIIAEVVIMERAITDTSIVPTIKTDYFRLSQ